MPQYSLGTVPDWPGYDASAGAPITRTSVAVTTPPRRRPVVAPTWREVFSMTTATDVIVAPHCPAVLHLDDARQHCLFESHHLRSRWLRPCRCHSNKGCDCRGRNEFDHDRDCLCMQLGRCGLFVGRDEHESLRNRFRAAEAKSARDGCYCESRKILMPVSIAGRSRIPGAYYKAASSIGLG